MATQRAPKKSRALTFTVTILLAVAGIVLAIGTPFVFGYHAMLAGLRAVSAQLVVALAISSAVSAAAKAGKLQLMQITLGIRLSFARTLGITLVTDSGFLLSPFGAAGYGINLSLLQRAGASWAQATTVVAGDQALDLAFFAIALPISILSSFRLLAQLIPSASVAWVAGGLASVGLVAWVAWIYRRRMSRARGGAQRRFGQISRLTAQWRAFFISVRKQWQELLAGPRWTTVALLLLATLQWLIRYGALWFILRELGYPLPFGFVVAAQALILHAALWTGIPAGGGSGDLALAAAFGPWVARPAVTTALFLWRFATLLCPLALGALGVVGLSLRNRLMRA